LQVGEEEEENARYVEKKMEENKTSPILPHTPSITTPTPKKSKLEKHLTNIVA